MMTSKRSLIGVATLFAVAAIAACGSDASAPPATTPSAGAPGAGAGGAPASGGGGASSAGAPAAGAASAGAPSAGAGGSVTAGAGGSVTAGAGGSVTAGAGGASAGAGGGSAGGGNTATFAKVSTLLGTSCAGGTCHNATTNHVDLTTAGTLYATLTTPLTDTDHCKGDTLITANDADKSFLLKVIQGIGGKTAGHSTCKNGNATEELVRMPDGCPGQRPCLTADQIKVVSDWVAAGAPQ